MGWKAGVAKADITPDRPIRLHGWGTRDKLSDGVRQKIYVKALAIRDESGSVSMLVTSDLIGFTRRMVEELAGWASAKHGIGRERFILNCSHNHSGPVIGDVLSLYFELSASEQAEVTRYTGWLMEAIRDTISRAIDSVVDVSVSFGQGLAGFGVNRRRARPGCRHLPGPVDHDVPVLSVRASGGGLLAVVFGYACHATAVFDYRISGDYPGFAQADLEERYPGAEALFVTGCGGNINPLPRFRPGLVRTYGEILATAVEEVLEKEMMPLAGELRAAFGEAELRLEKAPSREKLESMLGSDAGGVQRREIEYFLGILDRGERLPESRPYPVHVWNFGQALRLISLSGEPVVEYSLLFKERYGWDSTWVAGYSNELLAYIPTLRVLREGNYEGKTGMNEYGLPACFAEDIEQAIVDQVDALVRKTG